MQFVERGPAEKLPDPTVTGNSSVLPVISVVNDYDALDIGNSPLRALQRHEYRLNGSQTEVARLHTGHAMADEDVRLFETGL